MLAVQFVQQLAAQFGQGMLLGQAFCFPAVFFRILADEQDDQQHEAEDQEQRNQQRFYAHIKPLSCLPAPWRE